MDKWTKNEEFKAKEEYLTMIDTLRTAEELKEDRCGKWEDYDK